MSFKLEQAEQQPAIQFEPQLFDYAEILHHRCRSIRWIDPHHIIIADSIVHRVIITLADAGTFKLLVVPVPGCRLLQCTQDFALDETRRDTPALFQQIENNLFVRGLRRFEM